MATTPYAAVAAEYLMKGWDILPLPAMSKKTPPTAFTGENAMEIDEDIALGLWMESAGNIAFRMPKGLVGIDVDAYKDGGESFRKLIEKLGPLPETMGITSRDVTEGVTLLFAVPQGIRFKGSHGSIDIIQNHHRYAVAPPSIHPEGRPYRWVASSGQDLPWVPEPDEFPALPDTWIEYFREKKRIIREVAPQPEVQEELDFTFEAGIACKKMNSLLKGAIIRLKENQASRHDLMVLATWAMTGEAAKGHKGYDRILATYEKAWIKSFSKSEQISRPLALEFQSALRGAQRKISKGSRECQCDKETRREAPKSSSALKMWR